MFFKAFGSLVSSWSTIQITMHAKTGPTAGDIIASEMIKEFPTEVLNVITDCFRTEHWGKREDGCRGIEWYSRVQGDRAVIRWRSGVRQYWS